MKRVFYASAVVLFLTGSVFANKTQVSIEAPGSAAAGQEVTVKIQVSHRGNSANHFTDWVHLSVNGKQVTAWEYSSQKLPSSENFTLEYKIKITGDTVVEAEGHCNLHGSAGVQKITIKRK